ncbi:signal peptidase II [Anaerofustis sp.]|uniref:signal peptidase II n=1 Tax=Anaerofustis sp. TaxID=1872517 RepID=UPI0025C2C194|nr:signal peptidase II [Anaerofustis sp.]
MIYVLIVLLSVVLDQISKAVVINNLKPIGSIPLIENVFHFTYCENTGAAFSIFSKNTVMLTVVSFLFIVLVAYFLFKNIKRKDRKVFLLGLSFVLGGAIGNFIDRVLHGFVTDFFDFRLINFAIFNVADVFITIGGILFCMHIIFTKDENIF